MPVYGIGEGKNKEEVVATEQGKGLSTEDYTTEEKALVATISGKQNQHHKETVSLLAANWSNGSQTVNIYWVTADNTVLVSPIPSDVAKYGSYGIVCTTQGAGTLTFTCDFTPSEDISINVVILGV